ncbi:kinase-like domain-containing protein [Chlamydoabsidia padenii]|nr:kinase-like domain-containing protein [Chlamydoabsidia padenii]
MIDSRPTSANLQNTHTNNLSEKLKAVNFDTPAKIFQNKHAIHQFENVTPDVSLPGTPIIHNYAPSSGYPSPSLPPTATYTPSSLSPRVSGESESNTGGNAEEQSTSTPSTTNGGLHSRPPSSSSISSLEDSSQGNTPNSLSRPVSPEHNNKNGSHSSTSSSTSHKRPTTPSQFIFKKPEYNKNYHHTHFHHLEKKDTLLHELKRFFKHDKKKHNKKSIPSSSSRPSLASSESRISDLSFANEFNKDLEGRYGKWGRFVGKGAGGSVRLIRRGTDNKTFAVKQFRKRGPNENEKEYVKKVTAEFCIGSTLHHPNVIETLDIIQEGSAFYEIMEFAPNDLFNIVMSGHMSREEIACCWKQMLNGVNYLQSMGIAHRDLKLDNMVLDERGILKLIDFGCAAVIKYPHENKIHKSKGICGSDPYIAPEQYTLPDYDATLTDLWSCGIVYVCMIIRRFPWRIPRPAQDQSFKNFITPSSQSATRLFKMLPRESRTIISRILDPEPSTRCSLQDVMKDNWVASINTCTADVPCSDHKHHLLTKPSKQIMDRGNIIVLDSHPQSDDASTIVAGNDNNKNKKKKKANN